ncbi:MAG: GNAT family N-acetyltransferase [Clostridia bacterium]|nr:GNAT family N-acetyltransferase [Clostridia bacterium]
MTVRRMHMCDKEKVADFYAAMGQRSAHFFNVNHGNEKRTMDFFENGKKDHIFYVALEGEELVALAFIWDIDRTVPWFGIAVRDSAQGKGIGTAFMKEIFADILSEGYAGLLLRTATDNIPAQHLYEKCGFECLGVHPSGEYLYIKRFARN